MVLVNHSRAVLMFRCLRTPKDCVGNMVRITICAQPSLYFEARGERGGQRRAAGGQPFLRPGAPPALGREILA